LLNIALAVHRGNNFSIPDDDDPSHEIAINIVAADDDVTTAGPNFNNLFVALKAKPFNKIS
jgi:hypothetical protein